jgi:hypothetical protein
MGYKCSWVSVYYHDISTHPYTHARRVAECHTVLQALGWDTCPNPEAGIVVPCDFAGFLTVPATPFLGGWAMDEANKLGISKIPQKSGTGWNG